jgi:hypothetical protein
VVVVKFLTPAQVVDIKSRLSSGESQRSIARRYNVWSTTIWSIAAGRTWSDDRREVPPPGKRLRQHEILAIRQMALIHGTREIAKRFGVDAPCSDA